MTLKDLLKHCDNDNMCLNVTALAYHKENKEYYSFRTICSKFDEKIVLVKDYTKYFSEEFLASEVKSFMYHDLALWVDIIEWI